MNGRWLSIAAALLLAEPLSGSLGYAQALPTTATAPLRAVGGRAAPAERTPVRQITVLAADADTVADGTPAGGGLRDVVVYTVTCQAGQVKAITPGPGRRRGDGSGSYLVRSNQPGRERCTPSSRAPTGVQGVSRGASQCGSASGRHGRHTTGPATPEPRLERGGECRLPPRSRLAQILQLLGSAAPTEDPIAMREAAEARNNVVMRLRGTHHVGRFR